MRYLPFNFILPQYFEQNTIDFSVKDSSISMKMYNRFERVFRTSVTIYTVSAEKLAALRSLKDPVSEAR